MIRFLTNRWTLAIIALLFTIMALACAVLIAVSSFKTINVLSLTDNIRRFVGGALALLAGIISSLLIVSSFLGRLRHSHLILHTVSLVIGILGLTWVLDSKIDFVVDTLDTHTVWIIFTAFTGGLLVLDILMLFRRVVK